MDILSLLIGANSRTKFAGRHPSALLTERPAYGPNHRPEPVKKKWIANTPKTVLIPPGQDLGHTPPPLNRRGRQDTPRIQPQMQKPLPPK
jgi:hypothetical protein